MLRIYDRINNFEYVQGATEKELIKDWNAKAEANFSWILENSRNEDFYKTVTEKCYRLENIKDICKSINDVEVNCLTLYQDDVIIDW